MTAVNIWMTNLGYSENFSYLFPFIVVEYTISVLKSDKGEDATLVLIL